MARIAKATPVAASPIGLVLIPPDAVEGALDVTGKHLCAPANIALAADTRIVRAGPFLPECARAGDHRWCRSHILHGCSARPATTPSHRLTRRPCRGCPPPAVPTS